MELDFAFFAMAVPAVVFAGLSKGGFGSGAAFAATPFLALVLDPAQAVGLMLPLLMLMDVTALRPYWRKWHWPEARQLILGSVPGIVLGAVLFRFANPDVFRFLIGAVALGFVAYQLGRAALVQGAVSGRHLPGWAGYAAGAVAGFTSFISHAGGPPAAIFLLARGLDKTAYQATTVLVFWAINILKFVPYFLVGIFSAQTFIAGLYLAPAAVFGVWLGVVAHRLMPERLFFGLVYVFLVITGVKLVFDSLT